MGIKALMNVSVWPHNDLEKFWFFFSHHSSQVGIYEKCRYGLRTIKCTSFKYLVLPRKPWKCVHFVLKIFIAEVSWKELQQKVVLIIFNNIRVFISFPLKFQNSSAHSKKSLQAGFFVVIHIYPFKIRSASLF